MERRRTERDIGWLSLKLTQVRALAWNQTRDPSVHGLMLCPLNQPSEGQMMVVIHAVLRYHVPEPVVSTWQVLLQLHICPHFTTKQVRGS